MDSSMQKSYIETPNKAEQFWIKNKYYDNASVYINDEVLEKIISAMMNGVEIQPNKLGLKSTDLNEQQKALIDAFNGTIIMGIAAPNGEQKYSSLQKQIKDLKVEKRLLLEEKKKRDKELVETNQECQRLTEENEKAKLLIKTFKNAINDFENPAE